MIEHQGQLIAGEVTLTDVMARLREHRPVFHSEADLQHAFARVLWELAPQVQSRLEVGRTAAGRTERLDLLCIGPRARTSIEFKYWTRSWAGSVGPHHEAYALKNHGADDLARLNYISDIVRTERFCDGPDHSGLALVVTNAPALWTPPGPRAKQSRDHEFRIHQGCTLSGTLRWAEGTIPANTRTLQGTYPLDWKPYSNQPGNHGEFRYLAVHTTVSPRREL